MELAQEYILQMDVCKILNLGSFITVPNHSVVYAWQLPQGLSSGGTFL